MKEKINLVMVGHIDHGKSTLIGRLLYDSGAINPDKIAEVRGETSGLKTKAGEFEFSFFLDSIQEEREGGITIDTMQTPFESEKYLYTIIDCPGHKEFIKNMLTGASQADAAILLLSAKPDEGIQEQTKRHMFLVNMLGIRQVFIAINKLDTVDYSEKRYLELKSGITEFLKGLGYNEDELNFIPISALRGDFVFKKSDNMPWYNGPMLIRSLDQHVKVPVADDDKPLRFPVQDIYDVDGRKLVVGLIESGKIAVGDEIKFNPSGVSGKIKTIEKWKETLETASSGESVGFSFDDENVAKNIKRGDVGFITSSPVTAKDFKGQIFLLGNQKVTTADEFTIRCGTAETLCKINKITKISSEDGSVIDEDAKVLNVTDAGIIELSLQDRIAIDKFSEMKSLGRFVLIKEGAVAAAGIII